MAVKKVLVCWAGQMAYGQAWAWQQRLQALRRREGVPDLLLLLEHPPTYTCGRATRPEHLPADEAALTRRGIALFSIERGGSITYHGPGQLVGYPILALHPPERDVHLYIRRLEEVLIRALSGFGLQARARPGLTGVWIGGKKIAAIGIHVRHWVTMHGFALNVCPDLEYFRDILPCGLDSRVVTSMAELLPASPALEQVGREVAERFAEVFGCAWKAIAPESLPALASVPGDVADPGRNF